MSRYEPGVIEPKWQAYWEENGCFDAAEDPNKPKYYVLCMFPYPSGAGIHVGHPLSYTAVDITARYKRMNGFSVLNPIGFDAFGLPSERHAIRVGRHPRDITRENIATFTMQLKRLGFSYDWNRCVDTSDPDYYRWSQWIFLKLYERDLAYLAEVPVNWCPAQGTVLANEEVQDGLYVETGDPVERRMMRQWMLKITAYAERLLDDLEDLDWPEHIKEMQRNWIGKSEGAEVDFTIAGHDAGFTVFTTRPDTLYGATYCVLSPEHELVSKITTADRRAEVDAYVETAKSHTERERQVAAEKEKTGVFTGAYAVNPANGEQIPIWIADYVLAGYGTGAIMAVPAHDERDHAFARKFGIEIREVVAGGEDVQAEAFAGAGEAINSPAINGLRGAKAKRAMTTWLEEKGVGRGNVRYKLRDWLFSRQRYWGEPFPIIHLEDGTMMPVPAENLPVRLPELDQYKPTETGDPPLARATEWVNVEVNGMKGQRETNIMPQWAGSCWYYLRYMDAHNTELPFSPEAERYWGPVDLYIGGVEHAVLHLLYARFWHKVLYDVGLVHTKEPFQRLFNQGMILAESYREASGRYRHPEEVEQRGADWFVRGEDTPVVAQVEKMSKSKLNVVNPIDVIEEYGADALRMYEMFMGPLEQVTPWQTNSVQGIYRFLQRVWRLVVDSNTGEMNPKLADVPIPDDLNRALHIAIRESNEGIEALKLNTPISRMMEFVNEATRLETVPIAAVEDLLRLLSPYAPHLSEELWQRLGHEGLCSEESWPTFDEQALQSSTVELVVQVQGKLRGTCSVPQDADKDAIVAAAKALDNVQRYLEGMQIIKTIVVPGRLVNFVVKPA